MGTFSRARHAVRLFLAGAALFLLCGCNVSQAPVATTIPIRTPTPGALAVTPGAPIPTPASTSGPSGAADDRENLAIHRPAPPTPTTRSPG